MAADTPSAALLRSVSRIESGLVPPSAALSGFSMSPALKTIQWLLLA